MIVYKELSSIERDLGIPAKTLYGVSNNIPGHYRKVKIPKKDGSYRTLSVPDEVLKKIQRSIAVNLLAYEDVSVYAKAYKVGSGVKNNALPHVGKKSVLKLDIRNFFDSITYSSVKEKVFPENKYSEKIRILLSMLCYCGEVLPQGAPTSPIITNIIMRDFDETVGAWCALRSVSYTRYCDDMTFSGELDFGEVISFISDQLKKYGLFLNKSKTRAVHSSQRQTVTGVVVNEKINISSEYKREIRRDVFYCSKFGVEGHLERIGTNISPIKYLNSLMGRINYVLQMLPENREFTEYRTAISDMIKMITK